MKNLYIICIFIVAFAKIQAQSNLKMTPDTLIITGAATDDVLKVDIEVQNLLNTNRTLVWERVMFNMPDDWSSTVCDPITCWGPSKSTAEYEIKANGTAAMILDIFPEKVQGNAYIKLTVKDKATNVGITGRYRFVTQPSPTAEVNAAALRLYPNPTLDYFVLQGDAIGIKNVQIQSIEGRVLRTFDYFDNDIYDIQDFVQGTYFINLMGENGRRLATKRIVKQ